MKFTDRFLSFPIRVYDRFSMKKASEEEEAANIPIEGDWVQGVTRVDHRDIYSWLDYFDTEQGIKGVEADGFMFTMVMMSDDTNFICTLKRKDFEERLNKYAAKYEEWEEQEKKKQLELEFSMMTKEEKGEVL